jgi:phage terminase large subunit-like protein
VRVVAVDSAVSAAEGSAETGIIVAGLGADGLGYVLADLSLRGKPHQWAATAVGAYHQFKADQIVAETNNGGDMVTATILTQDRQVPVRKLTATRGKFLRAQPVSTLYERRLIRHVGVYPELENQMCQWVPGETSPDRLDACVWAFTALMADITRPILGRDFGIA